MKKIDSRNALLSVGNLIPGLVLLIAVLVLATIPVAAQEGGNILFPSPFLIEHQIIQTEADGSVFAGDPVTDFYGGSWIVSERIDGSRLVVDFARRELMEIRPERSSYTVVSFDRFAELRQRLQRAEGPVLEKSGSAGEDGEREEPRFTVAEIPLREGMVTKAGGARDSLVDREGVRHLRVTLADEEGNSGASGIDVWLDPTIRFGPLALAALEDFEEGLTRVEAAKAGTPFTRYLMEARRHSGGALPFRILRPALPGGDPEKVGTVEDRASRVERLQAFPSDLLGIPEGFERVPHSLELIVAHAEDEAELRANMSAPASR